MDRSDRDALDAFGRFVMENVRDRGLAHQDGLAAARYRAPGLQALQRDLAALGPAERDVVTRCVRSAVDHAVHDFLFALQDQGDVRVLVGGVDVAKASDGLHGEPLGADGWQARFSRYGRAPEIP